MSRVAVPLIAALLALGGALLAMLALYRSASSALDNVLDAELRGAGQSAAQCFSTAPPDADRLRGLMHAEALEGAFVVDQNLNVVADATGPAGHQVDLLRVDPDRIQGAFEGKISTAPSYELGSVKVASAYFPVRDAQGKIRNVLTLEAGQAFVKAKEQLSHSLVLGWALALVTALALAALAAGWGRTERSRREAAAKAARGEIMSRMAAFAAHEIRNPLGVIRGTIELMRERLGEALSPRDRSALADVLGEVERLRRLTQDFLDLAADSPLTLSELELAGLVREAARACEVRFPQVHVTLTIPELPPVKADAVRLHQVITNLLNNAAEAQGSGEIEVTAAQEGDRGIIIRIHDHGPGIAVDVRGRLFDPFMTTKPGGTGLGLALCRQILERLGGSIALVDTPEPGATFELHLPVARPGST